MNDAFNKKNDKVTADQVTRFLREDRGFFTQHPDLLAEIELPHHSGQAISLVEKQVSILRERNIEMRQRLNHLLDNARDNDLLFDKTKRLILAILECKSLADMNETLYYSFTKDFGIHYTRIILFGSNGVNAGPARIDSINRAKEVIGKRLQALKSVSGGVNVKETEYLFDDDAPNVGSAAFSVLSHGNIFGILAIGNQDPTYYRSSMGTIFLGYIAEVLNRTIPNYLNNKS